MPTYEYRCKTEDCGTVTEAVRSMKNRKRAPKCSACGGATQLIISPTTFALKGGGWANDGYGPPRKTTAK